MVPFVLSKNEYNLLCRSLHLQDRRQNPFFLEYIIAVFERGVESNGTFSHGVLNVHSLLLSSSSCTYKYPLIASSIVK